MVKQIYSSYSPPKDRINLNITHHKHIKKGLVIQQPKPKEPLKRLILSVTNETI